MFFFRKNIPAITLISFVILGLTGGFVFAAGLVPCGPGIGKDCTACDFYQLINNIINFITLQVVPVLAVVMIMVGAFFMITAGGSETSIKKGKDIITMAIIGSVIIMSAWLVIDIVLKNLATGDISKSWYDIKCEQPPEVIKAEPSGVTTLPSGALEIPAASSVSKTITDFSKLECSPKCWYQKHPDLADKNADGSNWTMTEKANLYTHDEALRKLKDQGITVTSSKGEAGLNADNTCVKCTSLNGMPKEEINKLVEINKNCSNCGTIIVTGGTEAGHQSQGFGRASMDLNYSENLYNNLKNQSGITAVREKQFNTDGTCDAGWKCYKQVTGQHISFYVPSADLY